MDRAGPAEREGAAAQARPTSDECLAPEFVADMLVGGDPTDEGSHPDTNNSTDESGNP